MFRKGLYQIATELCLWKFYELDLPRPKAHYLEALPSNVACMHDSVAIQCFACHANNELVFPSDTGCLLLVHEIWNH